MKTSASFSTQVFRKWDSGLAAIGLILVIAMCSLNAMAQSGAGTIQGTVTDSTGAVIHGASIHIVNQATGVASDTKSNEPGSTKCRICSPAPIR